MPHVEPTPPHEPPRRGRATERRAPSFAEPRPPPAVRGEPGRREQEHAGYYGHRAVKPPTWTWEIGVYFFVGGIAGGSALLALGALAGQHLALVRAALWVAVVGAAASAALLISDLKRPKRFFYMLRVFKWRSPMSVGVWVLSLFGAGATLALLCAELSIRAPESRALVVLTWIFATGTAPFAALLITYTGVLLAVTAVPAWAARRRLLPLHFGTTALGSAASLLELLGFRLLPLWALAFLAALVETGIAIWLETTKRGARDKALHQGRGGRAMRGSGLLSGPLSLVFRLTGWIVVADLAFLAGALLGRFAWVWAGKDSANDPAAALDEGAS